MKSNKPKMLLTNEKNMSVKEEKIIFSLKKTYDSPESKKI